MKDKILNSKYKKYFSLLIFSIFYLLFAIRAANAQNTTHLIVAPSRQEILVEPGETTAINIKFLNQTDAPIPGTVGAVDFIVEDKEGTPTFIEGTPVITGLTQISSRFSAASWFELPYDRATIPANGKVLIQAKIRVPVDARPGGRYVAIYFEPSTTPLSPSGLAKEGTTPVASRIVGLVYLRVAGPIKEDAYVVRFGGPNFSQYGPITILTEILNRGDYHITPKGVIKIYNMFNQEIDRQKLEEKNIFPDASRVYENKVGQKWMFGKYKAELSASYGETGKALTATTYFWVIPYKEIIAGVLAIAIIILLAIILYRRLIKRQLELQERVKELEKKLKEK